MNPNDVLLSLIARLETERMMAERRAIDAEARAEALGRQIEAMRSEVAEEEAPPPPAL